jgi:uncharacterized protein (TIGR02996 family)
VTDEDDFQAMLDAHPDDHVTRLVFADWLQERGDPRAEGYRALGVLGVSPTAYRDGRVAPHAGADYVAWWNGQNYTTYDPDYLPGDWWHSTLHAALRPTGYMATFRSRREAEDAAALAFAELPAERRAELLASVHHVPSEVHGVD